MIRSAKDADLPAICEIERKSFGPECWSEDSFVFELHQNPYSHVLVLEDENRQVAGFVVLWTTYEQAQIANVAVDPALRRKGYGNELLDGAIALASLSGCESMTLEVRVSNTAAIELYEHFEFTPLRRVAGYYSDGEDALLMGKGI